MMDDDLIMVDDDFDGDSWSDGYKEGRSQGQHNAISAIAKYLADDWHIVSRETLPNIFDFSDEQDELWDCVVSARQRKLKYLQSEVKSLTKKLEKIKAKENKK
jgi:hypothetical protein